MVHVFPKDIDLKGLTFVTGFHGIGSAGYWTVKFLIQALNSPRIAILDTDEPSPVASTNAGRLSTPYELHRTASLVFFKAETPPYGGGEVKFFKDLADWVLSSGFKEAVLIGGLDSRLRTDDSTHRIVYTSSYLPAGEFASPPILEEGRLIVGPIATMLNHFEARNLPAYAILTYATVDRVDPRAAAIAAQIISRQYGFKIDVEPLLKGAELLETQIAKSEEKERKAVDSMYA